uniref:Uncharacterized protein n=1 Tax=Arundo donax TaxID=35708 RepID=A0A0A9QM96_ARUDO
MRTDGIYAKIFCRIKISDGSLIFQPRITVR